MHEDALRAIPDLDERNRACRVCASRNRPSAFSVLERTLLFRYRRWEHLAGHVQPLGTPDVGAMWLANARRMPAPHPSVQERSQEPDWTLVLVGESAKAREEQGARLGRIPFKCARTLYPFR